MTPKELRTAAELLLHSHSTDKFNDLTPGYEEAADAVAEHVLATARDDDDEAVTVEWISRYWNWRSDGDGYGYAAKIWGVDQSDDRGIEPAMQLLYEAESLWIEAYGTGGETLCLMEIKEFPTRGDVRKLCSALGIELKEPT